MEESFKLKSPLLKSSEESQIERCDAMSRDDLRLELARINSTRNANLNPESTRKKFTCFWDDIPEFMEVENAKGWFLLDEKDAMMRLPLKNHMVVLLNMGAKAGFEKEIGNNLGGA